jgi:hypothetical protein
VKYCAFENGRCARCGHVARHGRHVRQCRSGLGDMVATGLSAVGITKERVSKLLGGDCGCGERQRKLNEIGRKYLGIGSPTPSGPLDS